VEHREGFPGRKPWRDKERRAAQAQI